MHSRVVQMISIKRELFDQSIQLQLNIDRVIILHHPAVDLPMVQSLLLMMHFSRVSFPVSSMLKVSLLLKFVPKINEKIILISK
jgi:hypothetical protein